LYTTTWIRYPAYIQNHGLDIQFILKKKGEKGKKRKEKTKREIKKEEINSAICCIHTCVEYL
jgi:hypothetical protein